MEPFLMKPKIDFAFKEIMNDETALRGFLSAVLGLKAEEIQSVKIQNTDLRKVHTDDKQGILDVNILLNDNTEINIEIQLTESKVWPDRSLFYLSKKYVSQLKEGDPYTIFKRCVAINILDFKLFKDQEEYYSCFHIREDKRNILFTDKMEFHIIELPKLPKEIKEGSSELLLWSKFIGSEKKEDFEMLAEMNEGIRSAYQRLQVISQNDEKRIEYEARMKAIHDFNQGMYDAEERGAERGRKEGHKEGLREGRQEERKENIKSMMKYLPIEQVAKIMKITVTEVQTIINS